MRQECQDLFQSLTFCVYDATSRITKCSFAFGASSTPVSVYLIDFQWCCSFVVVSHFSVEDHVDGGLSAPSAPNWCLFASHGGLSEPAHHSGVSAPTHHASTITPHHASAVSQPVHIRGGVHHSSSHSLHISAALAVVQAPAPVVEHIQHYRRNS